MTSALWPETLQQDLRYACRLLWRAKGFTGAAVLTLTLGIAGTIVMFALIQGVLLRPLPVFEQDRLIIAWKEARTSDSARYPFGNTEIVSVAEASQLLVQAAGVTRNGVGRSVLTHGGTSSYANVALVTGGFFDVLGVRPLLGRALAVSDEQDGAESVAVISSGLWQRRFGGARDVIGRNVLLAEQPFTIVGVMPPDLDYPSGVEIWRTTSSVPGDGPFGNAARREVNLIGRLRPGVTIEQAASEITALSERIDAPSAQMRGLVPVVRPFVNVVTGDARTTIVILFGAVALVLLIASANVANLLLMRGEARRTEMAVRAAVGAGRGRIVRQVFAESIVLAALGGAAGLAIAAIVLPMLITLVPEGLPRVESIRLDRSVVGFSVAIVFVTALLAGLVPGLLSLRVDIISSLRSGATHLAGAAAPRGRRMLMVAQVALAVMVLTAAGLLIRSVLNLQAINLGLPAERLVLLDLYLPPAQFAERQRREQFLDDVIARLESIPAIAAATPVNVSPFSDRGWDVPGISAEGQSADDAAANPTLNLESVHPNYFAAFEIPIVLGRAFTSVDRQGAPAVAIVSEDVAARLWPQQNPLGKRIRMGGVDSKANWLEVIGVAAQTRYRTVTSPRPTLYLAAKQFQMTASMLVVRTNASLELLTSVANERIAAVDRSVSVMRIAPFTQLLERPLARPRFSAFLLTAFGLTALLLATIGLYAVVAAHVRQREREIALRLALGASAQSVRRLVLSEALRLAVAGAIVGMGGAVLASRLLAGMLYEINPLDPITIIAAAFLLVGAAALASYGPMRRAERADVMTTLRTY